MMSFFVLPPSLRHVLLLVVMMMMMMTLPCVAAEDEDDDFQPRTHSPENDVKLAHDYPHLNLALQEQDNTFLTDEESKTDYLISLTVFPALLAGGFFVALVCFSCIVCCRCCFLGCLNCCKCCWRLCIKDCWRKSKEKKAKNEAEREKRYAIYSKTFPLLLFCCAISIIWVFQGADRLDGGVEETKSAMHKFGNIIESISDELDAMTEAGARIENFLANNTCPDEVSSYFDEIEGAVNDFNSAIGTAADVTGSAQPAIDRASDSMESSWARFQKLVFDTSAFLLLVVLAVYVLGVVMKTAIFMRLGILLTVLISLVLCILVFIEMVVVMGYADYCMAPTVNIERQVKGMVYDVIHYYTSCEGDGPLHEPVSDTDYYNNLMNSTYTEMLIDYPDLEDDCKNAAKVLETSFSDISINILNIVEFSRCPYIHDIYADLVLDGLCTESYAGLYNIHVSHLSTLVMFFLLIVNAALLYPHYKGKTLRHICCCFYRKGEGDHGEEEEVGVDLFEDMYSDESDNDVESGASCLEPVSITDDDVNVEMVVYQEPDSQYGGDTSFVYDVNPALKDQKIPTTAVSYAPNVSDHVPTYLLGEEDNKDYY